MYGNGHEAFLVEVKVHRDILMSSPALGIGDLFRFGSELPRGYWGYLQDKS